MKTNEKNSIHDIDIDLIEMTLDVMKYAIARITDTEPHLGQFKSEEKLKELVGETITKDGIGGEVALDKWKKYLAPACASVDHPRHLAFVAASPSRASIMFDLIVSASCIHGAYWLEGREPSLPKIKLWNGWYRLRVCLKELLACLPLAERRQTSPRL